MHMKMQGDSHLIFVKNEFVLQRKNVEGSENGFENMQIA